MDVCGRLNARLAAAELAATAKLGVAAKLAAGAIVKAASVHGFAGAVSLGVGAESAKAGGKPPTNFEQACYTIHVNLPYFTCS